MPIDLIQNIAYISSFLFFLYFVLMLFGVDIDFGVDAGILSFFSFQGLLIGVMTFSWGSLFFSQYFESSTMITIMALSLGVVFVLIFKFIFNMLKKTSSEFGIAHFEPKKGLNGVVYLTVPANEGAGGLVTFEHRNIGTMQLEVVNSGDTPIPTGDRIVVDKSELNSDGETYTIYVKPVIESVVVKKEEQKNNIVF